jgi:hypothetical protein
MLDECICHIKLCNKQGETASSANKMMKCINYLKHENKLMSIIDFCHLTIKPEKYEFI